MSAKNPQLHEKQFDRACSLREYLEAKCLNGVPGRLTDTASYAILNWLQREYRLGMKAQRRRAR